MSDDTWFLRQKQITAREICERMNTLAERYDDMEAIFDSTYDDDGKDVSHVGMPSELFRELMWLYQDCLTLAGIDDGIETKPSTN